MKPETRFRQRVDRDLEELKASIWFESIQQQSIHGTPDKLGCGPGICIRCGNVSLGHFYALELKSESGAPTELQKYKLEAIQKVCGTSWVVTPANWPEYFERLKSLARRA